MPEGLHAQEMWRSVTPESVRVLEERDRLEKGSKIKVVFNELSVLLSSQQLNT